MSLSIHLTIFSSISIHANICKWIFTLSFRNSLDACQCRDCNEHNKPESTREHLLTICKLDSISLGTFSTVTNGGMRTSQRTYRQVIWFGLSTCCKKSFKLRSPNEAANWNTQPTMSCSSRCENEVDEIFVKNQAFDYL